MDQLGGDVPSLPLPPGAMIDEEAFFDEASVEEKLERGMFGYWALRITSDYRYFFFIHGNSSAGPWETNKAFDHGSLLDVSRCTEDGNEALSYYVGYVLTTYRENRYYLS